MKKKASKKKASKRPKVSRALRAAVVRAKAIVRKLASAERKATTARKAVKRLEAKLSDAHAKVRALKGSKDSGPEAKVLAAVAKHSKRMGMATAWTVRKTVKVPRETFDRVALELMRQGRLVLHHHDHPQSLGEAERAGCVWAGKTCFHAMAVRK